MRHTRPREVLDGVATPVKYSQNWQERKPSETQVMQGFFITTSIISESKGVEQWLNGHFKLPEEKKEAWQRPVVGF